MEKPFRFIEYKTTYRDEFDVTEGRQPTFALFYLKEGSFRLRMDGTETVIGAGDCAVFADDVDFNRSVISPIRFIYLKFAQNPQCSFSLPLPMGRVTVRDRQRFLSNLDRYEALMDATDARSLYYREHCLEDILVQLSDEYTGGRAAAATDGLADCHDPLVHRAVTLIREGIRGKLRLAELCRALSTNPSTLNFKFRKELSLSVGAFITAERMRTATRLLVGTSFSVCEIAARCGYENIYYFSTAFRKCYGVAPSVYRSRYRG